MTIVVDFASALLQAGIDPGFEADEYIGSSLRRGWDYWLPETPDQQALQTGATVFVN